MPHTHSEAAPLRLAVIGCGAIGKRHVEAIKSSAHAVLSAICDVDGARAESAARGTEARHYAEIDAMLAAETLDAVCIATPDHLHVAPVLKALENGCHVFCEKPLAMSLAEARSLTEAADRSGKSLAVDYNRRFGFGYRKAQELIAQGRIGTVTHAYLRVTDEIPWFAHGRGPYALLFSLLTHHIDLMRCFCGEVTSVHARLVSPDDEGKFFDAVLSFQFAEGAIGTLIGGWRKKQSRTIEIAEVGGTEGYLQVEDVQMQTRLIGHNADHVEVFQPNYFVGDSSAFYDSLTAHIHDFLARLTRGEAPAVSGHDGVRGLEIVQAAIESYENGKVVAL